jgi:isopenicillin N synthase-like dioxygenase
MIAGAIPLIDVSGHLAGDAEASRKAAAQLRWAFENVGFYYVSGHGVAQSLIDRTYEAAARFHAQPMTTKLALKVNEHNIGYLPISDAASPQAAAQGRKPSQNEAYFLRRERAPDDPAVIAKKRFHGLNQWPADPAGISRDDSRIHAHAGGAVPPAGAALRPGAWLARRFLRPVLRRAPHDPAHVALPTHRGPRRDGREPGAAY